MLSLKIPATEVGYDPTIEEFISFPEESLTLEYSLASIAEWESKYKVSFMDQWGKASSVKRADFFSIMAKRPDLTPDFWYMIPNKYLAEIMEYMGDPMTATKVTQPSQKKMGKKIITAEILYGWMFLLGIPLECEHWHLNRLLKQIEVGFVQQGPKQKMPRRDYNRKQASINAKRRAKMGSSG